jgi:hypothetical protein
VWPAIMGEKKGAREAIWEVQLVAVLRTTCNIPYSMRLRTCGRNDFAFTCKVLAAGVCEKSGFGRLEDGAVVDGKVMDEGHCVLGLTSHLPSSCSSPSIPDGRVLGPR